MRRLLDILVSCGLVFSVLGTAAPAAAHEPERLVVAPGEALRVDVPAGGTAEAAFDGGVMHPVKVPLRAPSRGDHWLALVTRGALGAVSSVRWVHLVVDATPPRCKVTVQPAAVEHPEDVLWVRPATVVSVTAQDDMAGVASVQLLENGAVAAAGRESASAALEREGTVRVEGVCRDVVGNSSVFPPEELHVDGTPPDGTFGLEGRWVQRGGRPVAAPGAAVVVHWTDAGSGVAESKVERNGKWLEGDRLEGSWEEGEHEVRARAKDWAGNETTTASYHFVVDGTPPVVRCSPQTSGSAGGDAAWLPGGSMLRCEAEDTLAGVETVEWSPDGQAWQRVRGNIPLTEGGVRVRAVDRVGNVREIRPAYRIDATGPVVEIRLANGKERPGGGAIVLDRGQALSIGASDSGSGIARVEYRINGGRWAPVEGSVLFRDTGSFLLEVRAVDRAGNTVLLRRLVSVNPVAKGGR